MSELVRIDATRVVVDGQIYTLGSGPHPLVNYFKDVNWRTTVSGIVTAVSAFIAFSPNTFAQWPLVLEINKFILAGGIASLGLAAKDSNRGSNIPTAELPPRMQGTDPVKVPAAAGTTVLGPVSQGPA